MSACTRISQSGQVVLDGLTAKKINNLLNSSKTRLEGLQLLNLFLPQCSDEEFLNSCVSWMQNCCKTDGLTKNTNYPTLLLCKLLKTSSKYPELKKLVSGFITTRYFDFFFKYLLNCEVGWICTETCLCLYRGACGPFQEGLEKHLTCKLDSNAGIPSTVARCFALLPSTGGAGNDGENYKKNWKRQFVKILSVCQCVLTDLFSDVEDFQEHVPLENMDTNGSERNIEHLATRFENYCSVLGFMLLSQYPGPKNVPSDLVFQLICRGLAVNPKALRRRSQTTDLLSVQRVLPQIHCSLFSLLKAVIVTCKNQLLPYSHLICKIIKQSLLWTESEVPYASEKPHGRLRISIYECLCDWLIVARSGSCVEVISDVIVSSAANDISSKKGAVFLKESKTQSQSKSRDQTTDFADATTNSELCHAALRALQFLLKFLGALLKPEVHKFLQEVVIKLLVEVQRASSPEMAIPLALRTCRVELYSLLLELVHQPCSRWPPPTNFALKLLARGINDSSPEVSSFCSAALNYITIIIHPQYNNGGFPLCYTPGNRRNGRELQWREEPMEVVADKAERVISRLSNENLAKADETDRLKKVSNVDERSEISSGEESRNTVTPPKDMTEFVPETARMDEGEGEEFVIHNSPADVDHSNAGQLVVTEKSAWPKTPSPVRENQKIGCPLNLRETAESNEIRKPSESVHASDSQDSKSISPESPNEGGHPRGRYFLRSKTKGSSEEPEETLKRTSSVESLKGTPLRSVGKVTPSGQSSVKRPRTRALSKIEGSEEKEGKCGHDDEEDIRAAFDDSFVD